MSKLKESIILNFVMPVADMKFGTAISRYYRLVKEMSCWTPERVLQWQTSLMQARLKHAYEQIPYYTNLFHELRLKPGDFQNLKDLTFLPILTKDIIRTHYDDIVPRDLSRHPHHKGATGGSTGTPMRYLCDNKSWSMTNAFNIFERQSADYHYGDQFIAMGGSSISAAATHSFMHKVYYRVIGKNAMGSTGINEEEMHRYFEFIRSHNIKYIYGYASVIYLFAKYVKENNLQDELDIKAIFPTSDVLANAYASLIQETLKCKILDSYGAFDGCVSGYRSLWDDNGFKCGYGTYVETDEMISPTSGKILVTDLVGRAFPFIRYELGDVVDLDLEKSYSSIHNGQVIRSLQGRESNMVKLKNGFYISEVSLHNAFKDIHIDGYKVEVEDSKLIVTVIPTGDYTLQEENAMKQILIGRTGGEYDIEIRHKDKLERRKNGKSLYIMTDNKIITQ